MSMNPFDEIMRRMDLLEKLIKEHNPPQPKHNVPEIIDRETLCKRLGISLPTCIRYTQRKIIPVIRLGVSVRYDWHQVLAALQKQKNL